MKINKAFKFKIYPNSQQKQFLVQSFAIWTFSIFMILTIWDQKNPIYWVRAAYGKTIAYGPYFTIRSI